MKATLYPSRHSPLIPNQNPVVVKILFSGVCAFLGKDINSDFWRFWIWFSWRWQLQSIKLYFVNSNQQRLDSVLICFFHCFAFSIVYSSLIRFVFSGIFESDIIWDALDASRTANLNKSCEQVETWYYFRSLRTTSFQRRVLHWYYAHWSFFSSVSDNKIYFQWKKIAHYNNCVKKTKYTGFFRAVNFQFEIKIIDICNF